MSDAEPLVRPMEVAGNRLTLLPDGPERLEALIALIDGARGIAPRPLLYLERRRRGTAGARCTGRRRPRAASRSRCSSTASARPRRPEGFFQPLIDAQARFCRFVPRWGRRYLLRNHQKLALADGSRVIIGGFNISDDYFGTVEEGAWRDLGLEVEGPSVAVPRRLFRRPVRLGAKPEDAAIRDLRRMLSQNSVHRRASSTGCSAGRRGGSAPGRDRCGAT